MGEIKSFLNGGMDKDSSHEFVDKSDFLEAFNCRVSGNAYNEEGVVSNIESNEIIEGTRAEGINKGTGAAGFSRLRKGYAFSYNSQGYHKILEIDYDLETETTIFTNITDSGGVNVLPLDPQYYLNDIKLINGEFLVFTDNKNEPCYISLTRLKDGSLGTLTADDFKLIKAQPLILPTATYNNDSGRSTNLLRGNLFQFAYYNTFLDYEDSALSSYSKMVVPENETTPATGTDVTKDNNIIVSVDAANDRVKTLNIAARIGGQSTWFLIKSIERADVIAITDTEVDVASEVYEAYDPSTNLYSFAFYNDGSYPNLDPLFTDLPYDYVPLTVGSLEVINGSILALGDLVEGYDRPEIDATVSVVDYDPGIAAQQPDPSVSLRVSFTDNDFLGGVLKGWRRKVTITYAGTAKTGDIFMVQVRDARDSSITTNYTYTVQIAENNNTALAVQKLATFIPRSSVNGTTITFKTDSHFELSFAKIDLQNAGTGVSKSIHSIKTNSSYQLALAHYDRFGRFYPIATNSSLIAKTRSYAQSTGMIPKFVWTISGTPPKDAVSYQWLLTENNTHQSTLYITGAIDSTLSDSDYLTIKITPLLEFNNKNTSSVLTYDYTAGDRCTFLKMIDGATTTWFNSPAIDVEVAGFEIAVDETTDPHTTNYLLKVRKSSAITTADITGKNLLLEIYTPKKRMSVIDGEDVLSPTLFYEAGERMDIVNGTYSTTSGEIKEADSYFKTRELASALNLESISTYLVEDFNFSDYYQSNYNSFGRARTYDDMSSEQHKLASIRYSDPFLEGSRINGINRFFAERIYGDSPGQTSSNYGAINKIVQVDNYLWVIQDTKCGSIPVNVSIIEDQAAQESIAVSDTLLNSIRYSSAGNYGMGSAKESFAQRPDGTFYFVDPNNSLPIRIGKDGTRVIADKMSKFFRRTLQAAKQAGLKIIGYYDVFNEEYVIAIEQLGDVVTSFPFNESHWRYLEPYTVQPGDITITTQPTKGTVTYNNVTGKAIYIPNAGTSGSDSFVMSFLVDGVPTTKKVCINITAGDGTPDQFYFLDVTDAELSTVYTSNSILINGINMSVPISISAGEFRINGEGTWYTSANTGITVVNEDTVEVRQTSSGSFETATDVTLTIGGVSDTYTVTTREAVPVVVNYSLTKDSNPHVDLLIVPLVNGTNIGNIYPTSTGTFAGIVEGDTVYIGMAHSVSGNPWPNYSKANLVITADGVTIYSSGDKTDPNVVDLANYTFVAEAGVVYQVTAVSDSTATSYTPVSFSMNNQSSAPLSSGTEVVSFEFIDNTDGIFKLFTGQQIQPQNNVGFNWLTDANTGKLVVVNNSAYPLDFTLTNTAEGGSYSNTITIASSGTGEFAVLPKTGYSITYTDTVLP